MSSDKKKRKLTDNEIVAALERYGWIDVVGGKQYLRDKRREDVPNVEDTDAKK